MTTTITHNQPTSRRGTIRYKTNPFVANTNTSIGTRRLTNKTGDKMMIVSEHGEILAPAGFHEVIEVDKSKFVKLYVNGVKAFTELTNAGARVFELLFNEVQNNPRKDEILINFGMIDQEITPISRSTFNRGINELFEKNFLACTTRQNYYFLNIDYMFNGDRLAFIREFRCISKPKNRDPKTYDFINGKADDEQEIKP